MPHDLGWADSTGLAHLGDGYELASFEGHSDPFRVADRRLESALHAGEWDGDLMVRWELAVLRAQAMADGGWRMADGGWRMAPKEPEGRILQALEALCRQLATALDTGAGAPEV
ncbi:hypothetical protein [Sphingomonas bacterium]|uniref:hypothetical protein n=1 Tax=Sphingomonas bacterium TaxID=1895847 RepID=UPI00260C1A87|nr:hypothetical protein [Sphingomonas bacterium]